MSKQIPNERKWSSKPVATKIYLSSRENYTTLEAFCGSWADRVQLIRKMKDGETAKYLIRPL